MARLTQSKTIRVVSIVDGTPILSGSVQLRRGATIYNMTNIGNGYFRNDTVLPGEYGVWVDSVNTDATVPVGAGEIDRLDGADSVSSIYVTNADGDAELADVIPISNISDLQDELDAKALATEVDAKFDKAGGIITGDTEIQGQLDVGLLTITDQLLADISSTTGINSDTQDAIDVELDGKYDKTGGVVSGKLVVGSGWDGSTGAITGVGKAVRVTSLSGLLPAINSIDFSTLNWADLTIGGDVISFTSKNGSYAGATTLALQIGGGNITSYQDLDVQGDITGDSILVDVGEIKSISPTGRNIVLESGAGLTPTMVFEQGGVLEGFIRYRGSLTRMELRSQRNLALGANGVDGVVVITSSGMTVTGTIAKTGGTFDQMFMADGSVQKFAYAGIYVDDGATPQAIATGSTYTKLTGFTLDQISRNATSDVANDQIVITELGDYDIGYSISYQSGTPNVTFEVGVFGGLTGALTEQKQIHTDRRLTSADTGSASGCGLLRVTAVPYYIDLRASHDNGSSVNLTMVSSSLIAKKIGV